MNIDWIENPDKTHTGYDERGNRYDSPANQESVIVTLTDGRKGIGWDEMGAISNAQNENHCVKFLDYEIVNVNNSDGWVLLKPIENRERWECHLGNFAHLEDAKQAAVHQFMIARPDVFHSAIRYRMLGRFGYHDGFLFKRTVEAAGIELPPEIGISQCSNCTLTFNGEKI